VNVSSDAACSAARIRVGPVNGHYFRGHDNAREIPSQVRRRVDDPETNHRPFRLFIFVRTPFVRPGATKSTATEVRTFRAGKRARVRSLAAPFRHNAHATDETVSETTFRPSSSARARLPSRPVSSADGVRPTD